MATHDINNLNQWETFCKRLIELTTADKIEWEDWSDRLGRPDTRSPLFVTEYKQWRILVYKFASKYYQDEDDYEWRDDINIELIDSKGKTEWTLPKVPARNGLLDHIQFKAAEVDQLFNDIMNE